MNETELRKLFPRSSISFIDANAGLRPEESKPDLRPPLVNQASGKTESDARIGVRIIMHRVRLLDPDNAVGSAKQVLDSLCTCGLIPDDSSDHIKIEVEQVKVNHINEQRTTLHIKYP